MRFSQRVLATMLVTAGTLVSGLSWSDSVLTAVDANSIEHSDVKLDSIKPSQWLDKMEESGRTVSYQGTLVYIQGPRMETVQIYHKKEGSLHRERLVHLTGEAREIIRHGDKVICLHPRKGLVKLDGSTPIGAFPRNFAEKFRSIDQPYNVKFIGNSRIAGRPVVTLEVSPKDSYRYGFQLALDQETGLLLQSLMVDQQQNVLERFSYTQIEIGGEVTDAQLSPRSNIANANWINLDFAQSDTVDTGAVAAIAESVSPDLTLSWQISWVPPGFTMSAMDKTSSLGRFLELDAQNKLVSASAGLSAKLPTGVLLASTPQAMMYTDGLATFSIFIADEVDMGDSQIRSGATVASTRVKRDVLGSFSVTVVGEIPSVTAEKIANSVNRLN